MTAESAGANQLAGTRSAVQQTAAVVDATTLNEVPHGRPESESRHRVTNPGLSDLSANGRVGNRLGVRHRRSNVRQSLANLGTDGTITKRPSASL